MISSLRLSYWGRFSKDMPRISKDGKNITDKQKKGHYLNYFRKEWEFISNSQKNIGV